MTKPEIIMKDWSELTDDDMERIANGGYEPDSHEKLWFDQDKAYTSLYFMNMKLPDNAMEDAVSRLMSDSKCGRIFRVKGFMQNAEGKWLELNATHKNITVKPIERGQAVFIVIGEGLDKEHIDGYFVPV
jgi:G3E family GTPase